MVKKYLLICGLTSSFALFAAEEEQRKEEVYKRFIKGPDDALFQLPYPSEKANTGGAAMLRAGQYRTEGRYIEAYGFNNTQENITVSTRESITLKPLEYKKIPLPTEFTKLSALYFKKCITDSPKRAIYLKDYIDTNTGDFVVIFGDDKSQQADLIVRVLSKKDFDSLEKEVSKELYKAGQPKELADIIASYVGKDIESKKEAEEAAE